MRFYAAIVFCLWALQILGQSDGRTINGSRNYFAEEEAFYAETKQVNQFIKRFNAEENAQGVKMSPRDSLYRNQQLRQNYINKLFDDQSTNISALLKRAFINDVTQQDNPKFIDFHGGDWFGEAFTKFQRGNNTVYITLFMQLVKENLGSKWVIDDVHYAPYLDLYTPDEKTASRFLHPLSHELDFMNLDKVFDSDGHTGDYFYQGFEVDRLSIFLYELRSRTLQFEYVTGLKFHFFQIEGWYVEISEFNRPGLNRGWLISNLIKLEDGQQDSLKKFIYHLD